MTLYLSLLKMYNSGYKSPFQKQSYGPVPPKLGLPVSFFLSLSLSLSLFFKLIPWNTEALWVHFFARASKTQSKRCFVSPLQKKRHSAPSLHREGTCGLHKKNKSHVWGFIGFLCKPKNISLFFSPFTFSLADAIHPEDIPRSCWGGPRQWGVGETGHPCPPCPLPTTLMFFSLIHCPVPAETGLGRLHCCVCFICTE